MQKTISMAIAVLMLAAAPTISAIEDEDGREGDVSSHSYIPGYGITIWCSSAEHSLVPIGSPEEYGGDEPEPTGDLTGDAFNTTFHAYDRYAGWGFSGEPECAPADAINAANEAQGEDRTTQGFGGAAFMVFASDKGRVLTGDTKDDVFGQNTAYQTLYASCQRNESGQRNCGLGEEPAGEISSEGCGQQSIIIPDEIANHWQSKDDDPRFIAWDIIDPVGVDDDLNYCFASAGTVTGTFTG